MSDPLTTLMHAVQVMNLLKTLIMKTLKEHEQTTTRISVGRPNAPSPSPKTSSPLPGNH
ncbi:hypothetical protein JHK87_006591 [Glycine soja]|nr:hypothetical protein JHK87_006591 [Glycine soja]